MQLTVQEKKNFKTPTAYKEPVNHGMDELMIQKERTEANEGKKVKEKAYLLREMLEFCR